MQKRIENLEAFIEDREVKGKLSEEQAQIKYKIFKEIKDKHI